MPAFSLWRDDYETIYHLPGDESRSAGKGKAVFVSGHVCICHVPCVLFRSRCGSTVCIHLHGTGHIQPRLQSVMDSHCHSLMRRCAVPHDRAFLCKNNISMDRESSLLYGLQSMNMKKGNYIIGKFLSNLSMLTVMWLFVMLGAALMLPFRFPDQPLPFYDFISPLSVSIRGLFLPLLLQSCWRAYPLSAARQGMLSGLQPFCNVPCQLFSQWV